MLLALNSLGSCRKPSRNSVSRPVTMRDLGQMGHLAPFMSSKASLLGPKWRLTFGTVLVEMPGRCPTILEGWKLTKMAESAFCGEPS